MAAAKEKVGGSWIEHVRISEILPALRNPKLHDIEGISASISRFGFVAPLVVNAATGRSSAGHGRLEAVLAMYAKDPARIPRFVKVASDGEWMLPVLKGISFASEEEAEEYLVAANRWVEVGGWDNDALVPMLEQLAQRESNGALEAIGWSESSIGRFLADFDADASVRGRTPEQLADGYNAGAVKQIVVYFPAVEAEKVLHRLSEVMRAEKVESNSAAFERMLTRFEKTRKLKPIRVAA